MCFHYVKQTKSPIYFVSVSKKTGIMSKFSVDIPKIYVRILVTVTGLYVGNLEWFLAWLEPSFSSRKSADACHLSVLDVS